MRRTTAALAGVALLLAAGCSNDATRTPTAEPTPAPTAGPASPTVAAADCLQGRYRLARFVGVGNGQQAQAFGTGEGGDLVVTFEQGGYTLTGAGEDPVTVTLAGQRAELRVDGAVQGRYQVTGDSAEFTPGEAAGSATIELAGQRRELAMSDVASVLAPRGRATVACTDQALTLTQDAARLELERA